MLRKAKQKEEEKKTRTDRSRESILLSKQKPHTYHWSTKLSYLNFENAKTMEAGREREKTCMKLEIKATILKTYDLWKPLFMVFAEILYDLAWFGWCNEQHMNWTKHTNCQMEHNSNNNYNNAIVSCIRRFLCLVSPIWIASFIRHYCENGLCFLGYMLALSMN